MVPGRAASSDALLKPGDYDLAGFLAKIETFAPKVVAFNGEAAASKVAGYLKRPRPDEGPLGFRIAKAHGYRLPSSSSANATGEYAAKRGKWVEFGRWVREVVA